MATNTESRKTSSSTGSKSAASLARKVGESVRREISPVARKTGKQLGKAFQATAKAAEKAAKILGIRAKVSARQLRIRNLFLKVGESYYRSGKSGNSPEQVATALQPQVIQLNKLHQEIASLKLQEKKIRSGK